MYNSCRCPQCRRLLFKALKFSLEDPKIEPCNQCDLDCQSCNMKKCYQTLNGKIKKCSQCMDDHPCIQCRRYYYRVWMLEKKSTIEIKCPKCKKLLRIT